MPRVVHTDAAKAGHAEQRLPARDSAVQRQVPGMLERVTPSDLEELDGFGLSERDHDPPLLGAAGRRGRRRCARAGLSGRRILGALRLFRVDLFAGPAIVGGLLPVLGGLAAVGLGLEPVQGRLVALARCGVPTSRSPVAQVDQVSAVTGPGVTITGAPVPIDPRLGAVEGGILDRGRPRRLVPQLRGPVTQPGRGVTVICRHIPGHRPVQELVDLAVPLPTETISCIAYRVALIGEAVPAVGGGIPLIGCPVPLVRQ